MTELIGKVERALEKYSMLDGISSLAVAFSGGADSTALLDLLCGICPERGIRLEAIHVEHGIRGEASRRDAAHCERFCCEKGVPLTVVCADVPALAREWGCGIEEAGRRFRYETFDRLCAEKGIERIATAHHAGDNLETVIFNLARGSGLRGLCGIPPVRGNIIRPLILSTRRDIEDYCKSRSLDFVCDETNESDEYTRNYIRHNIVPALERINPVLCGSVAKTTALLREDEAYLRAEAEKYSEAELNELAALPDPILTRALYARLPEGIKPGRVNITAAVSAVRCGEDTRISVGANTAFIIRGERAYFIFDDRGGKQKAAEYEIELVKERITPIPGSENAVLLTSDPKKLNIHQKSTQASLNGDKIKGNIYIRPRRPGDKLRVRKMNRTVKNLMQESGIEASMRRGLPCFCDEEGILWIPGLPLRDGACGKGTYLVFLEKEDIK